MGQVTAVAMHHHEGDGAAHAHGGVQLFGNAQEGADAQEFVEHVVFRQNRRQERWRPRFDRHASIMRASFPLQILLSRWLPRGSAAQPHGFAALSSRRRACSPGQSACRTRRSRREAAMKMIMGSIKPGGAAASRTQVPAPSSSRMMPMASRASGKAHAHAQPVQSGGQDACSCWRTSPRGPG